MGLMVIMIGGRSLYNHLLTMRILTLIMKNTFLQPPKSGNGLKLGLLTISC